MNWVGGIRNRVKLKQEKKLQKEFFERKRLQKKLNITDPVSVNAGASHANNGRSHQSISQDLLALQVIMQTHDKPYKSNREIRKPTKVDLDHPNRHQPKFKNEEILDFPLPSSAKPSTLEFSEARDQVQHDKSPAYPIHQKEAIQNTAQKVDSYKPDLNTTASDFPLAQKSFKTNQKRNVGRQTKHSVFDYDQNTTKYSEFSESFECESKQDKLPVVYSFRQKKDSENTKREANSYDLSKSTATNSSLTRGNVTMNEHRPPNVDSFYQIRNTPSKYVCDQDQIMKRKVDSFELNNFEDVKRTRQEELFLSKQRSSPAVYEGKERYPKSKRSLPEKQQQPHLTFRYRNIEEQSPFVPYAAPAPYSLAARTTTYGDRQGSYLNLQKSDYNRSTSQRLTQRSPPNNNDDYENLEQTMEIYQPISHNAEHEKLFLAGCIQSDKTNKDNRIIMENDNYPLPSPATNEITIDCLNKCDPQSFLTDLQVLEEIIPENRHQPVKANPDEVMNMKNSSSQYIGQVDVKKILDNKDNAEIDDDRSEDWRNFVTAAKRAHVDTLVMEDKEDIRNENDHNEGNISTSESCSPRRSKNAAEELKEVMTVQQYESSQESSYYSSWSSSASENEDNQKRVTTKSGKLSSKFSKEGKQANPKEPIQTTGSQDLPSTSTSEQLQNNSYNQVYTLGLSNGLKHLSKAKELPARNPDQKRSNLSVFRIYPLSRSEEKGTQTLIAESKGAAVSHKSVQCEIWSTNPLTHTDSDLSEEKKSNTDQIHVSKIGKFMQVTGEDRDTETHSSSDSGLPDANTRADCEQNVLKGHEDKNTEIRPSHNSEHTGKICEINVDVKTSNYRVPTPPILDIPTNCLDNTIANAAFLEITKNPEKKTSNQLLQPVGYSAKNIIPDTPLIPTENTDTVIHENKFSSASTNILANTTITDIQSGDGVTTEQNLSRNIITSNSNVSSVETTTEIAASENKVEELSPQRKIIPNILNEDVQNSDMVTTEQPRGKIEKVASSVEISSEITASENKVKEYSPQHKIIPNILNEDVQSSDMVTTEQNSTRGKIEKVASSVETSTEITTSENKITSLRPLHAGETIIATGQTNKHINTDGESSQKTNPGETDTHTALHDERDRTTIPNDKATMSPGETDKTTTPKGDTDKLTTLDGERHTIPNGETNKTTTPHGESGKTIKH